MSSSPSRLWTLSNCFLEVGEIALPHFFRKMQFIPGLDKNLEMPVSA